MRYSDDYLNKIADEHKDDGTKKRENIYNWEHRPGYMYGKSYYEVMRPLYRQIKKSNMIAGKVDRKRAQQIVG